MARVRLKFIDVSECSLSIEVGVYRDRTELDNQISICIEDMDAHDGGTSIFLDLSTAIKFSKALRNEINKAKEVNNG